MSGNRFIKPASLAILMLLVVLLVAPVLTGVEANQGARPIVRYATRSDTTAALRQMPQIPPMPAVLGSIFEKPRKTLPNREGSSGPSGPDPVLQGPVAGPSAPSTQSNFEGVNNVNGVLPPDTQGDVGPSHYVQMVNLSFAIWDKSGKKLYGPVDNNTLWQGFGGPCETTNNGDPIVLYDHLADRWMMSQFALPRFPRGPFYQCIAVSQTPDPTGAWHRYEFTISDTKLNDYPKFGVWPDGYYMSVNQFKCNPVRCNWAGAGVVAFERDQMLSGEASRMVYFDLETVDSNLGGMLPADLDGPVPPAGAPNPFVQVDDGAWGYSGDQLQIWNFHVDWSNPTNSTFTFDSALPTAAFDANMCGYSRNCIPQPGGTDVDAISDRLMFRLQYRNFGTHETMVVNHTVDVDGADHAGVRWYEMRNSGSGWGIFQEGTYAPDSDHRWMGSIAMNSAGDIALGYSVSSGSTYPSIRFTGRLAVDTPGDMTFEEGEIIAGSGYQEHSSGRWGDYSMMSVDPVDDCTFWYTQEYYAVVGNAPWQTRIGSFKLSECGPDTTPPAAPTNLTASGGDGVVNLDWDDNSEPDLASYNVHRSETAGGPYLQIDSGVTTSDYSDSTVTNGTTYYYVVTAVDTSGNESGYSNEASATPDQSTSMHVGDLDGSKDLKGKSGRWEVFVTVTIHDESHDLVANATVEGTWSGAKTGTVLGTTGSDGTVTFSTGNMSSGTEITFAVSDVKHDVLTYDASANHDPEGDSDGNSITISK